MELGGQALLIVVFRGGMDVLNFLTYSDRVESRLLAPRLNPNETTEKTVS